MRSIKELQHKRKQCILSRTDCSITLCLNQVAMFRCLDILENMHSCAYSSSEFRDSHLPLQQISNCTKANRYRLTWE